MERLIKCCIAGEKKAFDDLINQYTRLVYATIKHVFNKYCFSHQEDDIHDLHNSLFLSLMENDFKKLKQFKGKSQFSTYIRVITVRLTLDYLRKEKKQFSTDSLDSEEKLPQVADVAPSHEEALEMSQTGEAVRQVIQSLSPDEQLLLKLAFYAELSPKEISKIMGISVVAYYTKKSRILGKIKNDCKKILAFASN